MGHKDLRLGKIVYILVFYNISFSWLLSLDGFQYIFLLRNSRVTVKTIYKMQTETKIGYKLQTESNIVISCNRRYIFIVNSLLSCNRLSEFKFARNFKHRPIWSYSELIFIDNLRLSDIAKHPLTGSQASTQASKQKQA